MLGTVAVIGMGQIGTSLAAAIRGRRLAAHVIGVARRAVSRREAVRRGIVDDCTADLSAVSVADVVVLATTARHIVKTVPEAVRNLKQNALLTDVGSTKGEIVKAVEKARKRRKHVSFGFIGGHPMAGTEKGGFEACDPDLFLGKPYLLIPSGRGPARHIEVMNRMVKAVGARPLWLKSAEEHDRVVAFVSHLPHLIAYALMESSERTGALPHTGAEDPLSAFAGRSFHDATRVAQSPPDMVLDLLLTNRRHVPAVSRAFRRTLTALENAVAKGDARRLRRILERARRRRGRL